MVVVISIAAIVSAGLLLVTLAGGQSFDACSVAVVIMSM